MAKQKPMTTAEFAKELNLTQRTIQDAIKVGRIPAEKVDGKWVVTDPEAAKSEYMKHTSIVAARKKAKQRAADEPVVKTDSGELIGIGEAERREKVAKAKLAEIKVDEAKGKLVDAKKVQAEAFNLARKVRDAILNVPGRISHELAVTTDPHSVEVLLKKELIQSLEELVGKGESK